MMMALPLPGGGERWRPCSIRPSSEMCPPGLCSHVGLFGTLGANEDDST